MMKKEDIEEALMICILLIGFGGGFIIGIGNPVSTTTMLIGLIFLLAPIIAMSFIRYYMLKKMKEMLKKVRKMKEVLKNE